MIDYFRFSGFEPQTFDGLISCALYLQFNTSEDPTSDVPPGRFPVRWEKGKNE